MQARDIRKIILEQSHRAHVGHIGSSLSIADIIAVLYRDVLRISEPSDHERDRFILSKGHAALALYAALFLKGWMSESDLDSFCGDGTLLGVHPERGLKGVDFATGSLGQGLSMGSGAALGAKMQKSGRRVFALLSDAECNEGSVWESAMFAAHHRLGNLYAIVDLNGQQALGYTEEVISLSPLADRWQAFGWDVHEVDGHNEKELASTIENLSCEQPHVLIAHTTFGKGVSYMESKIKWHYWPMSDEEYEQAMEEVECWNNGVLE
ncbi:MAG: transketolase [Planctomycetota bacterium]|jgi:transketolase|nr:transketolase [Planctomycetota bacterium]